MYEKLCDDLLRIIPDMCWSDEAVDAINQAVDILRDLDQKADHISEQLERAQRN